MPYIKWFYVNSFDRWHEYIVNIHFIKRNCVFQLDVETLPFDALCSDGLKRTEINRHQHPNLMMAFASRSASSPGPEQKDLWDYFFDVMFLVMAVVCLGVVVRFASSSLSLVCCPISSKVKEWPRQRQSPQSPSCGSQSEDPEPLNDEKKRGRAIPGNIFFTEKGVVWHSLQECAQRRTSGKVQSRRPCPYCAGASICESKVA